MGPCRHACSTKHLEVVTSHNTHEEHWGVTGMAFLHVDEVSDILFVWTRSISEHLIFELPIDKNILTVVLHCTIRSVFISVDCETHA